MNQVSLSKLYLFLQSLHEGYIILVSNRYDSKTIDKQLEEIFSNNDIKFLPKN